MRQYQPIWERIKKYNHASILAPVSNHRKIKKLVIKEKCLDTEYKFSLSERSLISILTVSSDPTKPEILNFSLEFKIKTSYIGVNDI